ncbi:MAG TPA: rod shape-determining protein RodA [Ignavibacteriales bacterium]|nr:rod shape-determining protein RodA [Ignavibacteriales bacterium]
MLKQLYRIDKIEDKLDLGLFAAVFSLIIVGLLAIYSSTANHPTASVKFYQQLFFAFVAIGVFFATYFFNPRFFHSMSIGVYFLSLFLLIVVLLMGKTVYGAKSWMGIGSFGFQPSELGKIGLIFMMAYYFSQPRTSINTAMGLGGALLIGLTPIGLIMLEPDMGTTIVYVCIMMAMIYWKGISLFGLFVVISPGLAAFASMFGYGIFIGALVLILAALIYFKRDIFMSATVFIINVAAGFFFDFIFRSLSPHQQKRILTFLDPNADPLGSGYNAIQAKVAIGSGGFFGKGFLSGNQTQLRFIPEQWTDFIFCVVGEEFGFLGSIIVIGIFFVLFMRMYKTAVSTRDKDEFSNMVVIGVLAMFFANFAINVGMTVGIMPVIGLPLPFISYGGSSLLVNVFLAGVVANIYRNRKHYA